MATTVGLDTVLPTSISCLTNSGIGLKYVQAIETNTRCGGCLLCLRAAKTLALKGTKGMLSITVPTSHCTRHIYDASTTWNSCAIGFASAIRGITCGLWADYDLHTSEVVVSEGAMNALQKLNAVQTSLNDPKAIGNAIHLLDQEIEKYITAAEKLVRPTDHRTFQWIRTSAYFLHVHVAHHLATNPRCCEFGSLDQMPNEMNRASAPASSSGDPPGPGAKTEPRHAPPDRGDKDQRVLPTLEEQADRTPAHTHTTLKDAKERMEKNFPAYALPELVKKALQGEKQFLSEFAEEPEERFGRFLFGVTAPAGDKPLDGVLFKKSTKELHPNDLILEDKARLLKSVQEFCDNPTLSGGSYLAHALKDGLIRPQGIHGLPGDPKAKTYVCAANAENMIAALVNRHLPKTGFKMTPEKEARLKKVTEILIEVLTVQLGGADELEKLIDIFNANITARLSGKWSDARCHKEFINALLYSTICSKKVAKGLARAMSIKVNEAIGKLKPRGIISGKDLGCVLQTTTAGLVEYLIFSIKEWEDRSVKHANKPIFARRVAAFLHANSDKWKMSSDFGAFDSSVRLQVRQNVENVVLGWAADHSSSPIAKRAKCDRAQVRRTLKGYGLVVKTDNCGRESGDRGTSVNNFITNFVLEGSVLWDHLSARGRSDTECAAEVRKFFQRTSLLADMMAEGDDAIRCYADEIIKAAGGKAKFVEEWIKRFAEYGFNLEPQTAAGRVETEDCLSKDRVEFVSTVVREVPTSASNTTSRVRLVPKPRKTLDSLCQSFRLPEAGKITGIEDAAFAWMVVKEKSLSLMSNCVDCPMLFSLLKAVHLAARHHCKDDIDILHMTQTVGYSMKDLIDRYGESPDKYYDLILQLRGALAQDKAADMAADECFIAELIGSAKEGSQLLEKDANPAAMLRRFVSCITEVSPEDFVRVWGAWRRVL